MDVLSITGIFKFVNNQAMFEAGEYTPIDTIRGEVGLRILVTLSSDVKITKEKVGTKTLTGGNMSTLGSGNQTYNVWNIK